MSELGNMNASTGTYMQRKWKEIGKQICVSVHWYHVGTWGNNTTDEHAYRRSASSIRTIVDERIKLQRALDK